MRINAGTAKSPPCIGPPRLRLQHAASIAADQCTWRWRCCRRCLLVDGPGPSLRRPVNRGREFPRIRHRTAECLPRGGRRASHARRRRTRVVEHLGQDLAISLIDCGKYYIHALLIGHFFRLGDGIGVPDSAQRPACRDLALAFAAGPDEPVDQGPVTLAVAACHDRDHAAPRSR